jgi:hypothetical protein
MYTRRKERDVQSPADEKASEAMQTKIQNHTSLVLLCHDYLLHRIRYGYTYGSSLAAVPGTGMLAHITG